MPGILLVLGYLLLLPPLLAKTILRPFFIRMGFVRFFMLVTLIQFMACLPIKMVLRWVVQPEVHRVHSGILLQYLIFRLFRSGGALPPPPRPQGGLIGGGGRGRQTHNLRK